MSWPTLRAAIDMLQRSRRSHTSLTLYGGEPLLEPELVAGALEYATKGPGASRLSVSMATNGTLLRGAVVELLALHRVRTQVSFDGVAAAQKLRGRGTHRLLETVIAELRSTHPGYFRELVSVGVTVASQSVPHLAASTAFLMRAGVQTIEIGPLLTADPGWTREVTTELEAQVEKVFRHSVRWYERTGEVPVTLLRKTGDEDDPDTADGAMCRAGSGRNLTVDADGQVYGCVMLAESYQNNPPGPLGRRLAAMRLGNIEDPRFAERLAGYPAAARAAEIFDNRAMKRSSLARCADCPHRQICTVCPVSICHIPRNADPHRVPDHVCAFYSTWGRWHERFPVQSHPLDVLLGRAPAHAWMRRMLGEPTA